MQMVHLPGIQLTKKQIIMKIKSIITILALFSILLCNAQTIKPLEEQFEVMDTNQSNIYFKDVNNNFDKYFGTWVYQDATHYFKITFSKKEQVLAKVNKELYFDELVCEYQYKKNGIEIYNTYGNNSTLNNYSANLIFGNIIISENKIKLHYSEPAINGCSRTKTGNLELIFSINSSNDLPQLQWSRTNKAIGISFDCDDTSLEPDSSDFLIPVNMILTQE